MLGAATLGRAARVGAVLLVYSAIGVSAANAFERPLTAGHLASFRGAGASAHGVIRFDDASVTSGLGDPRCPGSAKLRVSLSAQAPADVDLPCSRWRAIQNGYAYVDAAGTAGGVRKILVKPGRLLLRFSGAAGPSAAGPTPFVEAALTIGSNGVCGRFSHFTKNATGSVKAVGPSEPCRLPQPNFIVVVLDDVRADGIDWMAALQSEMVDKGVSFANGFVPDSVCCPSRASTLTGLYALRHGTRQIAGPIGGAHTFRESGADRETIAVWLHDAGYTTGLFGKYLNAYGPTEQNQGPGGTFYLPPGWDRWWAFDGTEHYGGVNGGSYQIVDDQRIVTSYTDHSSDAQYSTDLSATEMRSFIASAVGDHRPFFAYWAPYAAHGETPALLPAPAVRHAGLFSSLPPWRPPSWNEADLSDKPRWVQTLALGLSGDYGAVVRGITDFIRQAQYETLLSADEQLAQTLDLLADLGVDQDTVVVAFGDNGLGWGEHQNWGGKESPYEESIRVPFVLRYPRRVAPVPQGSAEIALNIDIAPTVADFAGVAPPYTFDGESLRGRLVGAPPAAPRDDFLLEYWRATRDTRFTYSGQVLDGDSIRLYYGNTHADPRPSELFEFDALGGVSPGAVRVAIGLTDDATFSNLADAIRSVLPSVNVIFNPATNLVEVGAGDPVNGGSYFWKERDQLGRMSIPQPIPDYLGVRDVANRYTWVEYETGERELYDLTADPYQLQNRAADPAYAAVRAGLEGRLDALVAEIQARH